MQRVNAPAGQMQLKGLIEAYVVSELFSFKREVQCIFLKSCIKCCPFPYFCYLLMFQKEKTGSEKGATILREWEAYLPLFWQLVPPSEEDSPEACAEFERVLAKQATTQLSAKWSNQTPGRCFLFGTPCVISSDGFKENSNGHTVAPSAPLKRLQFCEGSAQAIFWNGASRTTEGSSRRSCTLGNPCKLVCWR